MTDKDRHKMNLMQWGSEYQTCSVIKQSIIVRLTNGLVFKHKVLIVNLKSEQLFVRYSDESRFRVMAIQILIFL